MEYNIHSLVYNHCMYINKVSYVFVTLEWAVFIYSMVSHSCCRFSGGCHVELPCFYSSSE